MSTFSFKRNERLKSKIIIDKLFTEGKSFIAFPLKVVLLKAELNCPFPSQVAFTVSKRNFKKAVDRNLIKRRMREAYRLKKHLLYQSLEAKDTKLAIMFIYIGKEIPEYTSIEKGMKSALKKIESKI